MSPLRVPMMRPSSGVKPMLVSTEMPFFTAVTEAPLPKCAITMHNSSGLRCSILAVILAWNRVHIRMLRHGLVERGVKHRHMR